MAVEGNESVNEQGSQPGDEGQREQVEHVEAQQQQEENRIPQSRVEEMISKRIQKERETWERQHLAPMKQKYEELNNNLTKAEIARMKAMGWVTDEPEKPVTMASVKEMLESQAKQSQQRMSEYIYSQRITSGWREVQRSHPELAPIKGFQDSVLARYAENPQRDFVDVSEEVAKEFEGFYAARSNAAAKKKEEQMRPDRRVVPSGRGSGGGGGNKDEGRKQTVAEKIRGKLSERE
jgi:G3E family GTPase